MKKGIFLLAALLIAATAQSATLEWDAVTTYTDGTRITSPVTYQPYTGPSAEGPWTAYGAPVSTTSATMPDPEMGATLYYTGTAIALGMESAKASPVSLTILKKVPAAPMTIRIQ